MNACTFHPAHLVGLLWLRYMRSANYKLTLSARLSHEHAFQNLLVQVGSGNVIYFQDFIIRCIGTRLVRPGTAGECPASTYTHMSKLQVLQ